MSYNIGISNNVPVDAPKITITPDTFVRQVSAKPLKRGLHFPQVSGNMAKLGDRKYVIAPDGSWRRA